ncbi:spermidine/putrescine ABC transporter substrate-binding protein [Paenibacillus mesophilus]|nr:spermidine/putrescine ABC transporter substrate-binding protein [Paenibacillus mesophilus]
MKAGKGIKMLSVVALLGMMVVLSGCGMFKDRLNLYSWADNFDEEVIEDFEKKFNVKVNYDVFSNNEELLAKIQAGGAKYDVIQPSDYMVATMAKLGLLEELNKANIPNEANIADNFRNPVFDPGNKYSIMYTLGVTGIAYNKKYVKENIQSWSDLWNPKYKGKVVLLDDSREVIGMGLKKLNFSNSSKDEKQLQQAVTELKGLLPSLLAFDTDNIKQKMIAEEAWIGTVWSGDASIIQAENKDVAFVIPKEGSTIWADNYAIPKGAKHKELAEKFINYMLDPDVSVKNYESIGYSNPNAKAKALHSKEYLANPMINLTEQELKRTEWLVDVGDTLKSYDKFWTELKAGKK